MIIGAQIFANAIIRPVNDPQPEQSTTGRNCALARKSCASTSPPGEHRARGESIRENSPQDEDYHNLRLPMPLCVTFHSRSQFEAFRHLRWHGPFIGYMRQVQDAPGQRVAHGGASCTLSGAARRSCSCLLRDRVSGVSPMNTNNHGRLAELDAALAAAMAAALDRVGSQAEQVVMTARLATAVHMGRAAENAHVPSGPATLLEVSSYEAVSAPCADAARLVRPGGRR